MRSHGTPQLARASRQTVQQRHLPSVMSIRKKIMDQNTEPVMVAMASGYTVNTKPGPAGKGEGSTLGGGVEDIGEHY